jgi:hypothetical protein
MRGAGRLAIMASAWLAASPVALAAPRLSVGPVRGDPKGALPTQLATALCRTFECVLWPEVSSQRAPDLARARAQRVAGLLTGAVQPRAAGAAGSTGATVTLSLLTTSATPARTWSFPLTSAGALQATALSQLERDLRGLLEPPAAPPRPAAAATAAPTATAAAAVAPRAPPPPQPVEPRPAAPAGPPPDHATPAAEPAATRPRSTGGAPAATAPYLSAELGPFWAQRKLSYGGLSTMTGTLLASEASAIVGLRLRVEGFPAARSESPHLRGAGLLLDYARSIGLETAAPSGTKAATTASRLELGATWRAPPLTSLDLVLTPRLSYLAQQYTASPTIAGLPDADLSGLRLGLDAEAPVTPGVSVLLGAGWVRWLSARELIKGSPAYFPGGSAWALELEAGASLALSGPLSLRLLGEYASTRYALDADPSGTYAATSAEDRLLSLRAMLQGRY